MKNGEMYGKLAVLNESLKKAKSFKLMFAINRNCDRLLSAIKELEKVLTPSEGFQAYENTRMELCNKYADKDENGEPKFVVKGNQKEYVIADKKAFQDELTELRKQYAADIEAYELLRKQFNNMMDEESEVKIYRLKLSTLEAEQAQLPVEDRLSGDILATIWFMIEDDLQDKV